MKKSLIIFLILLTLTLALPAIAAFSKPQAGETNELVTIFSAQINHFSSNLY